jgi:hypothetical protein
MPATAALSVGGKGLVRTKNFDVTALAGQGQVVISSSSVEQRSFESTRYANGVFTKHLIAALQSKGAKTTLPDAFNYLKQEVENEVRFDRRETQTPMMKSRWAGGELILTMVPLQPRRMEPASPSSPEAPAGDKATYEEARNLYLAKRYEEAARLAIGPARSGYEPAQVLLGRIAQDWSSVGQWFQRAADQGNEHAQFYLGWLYESGQGVQQNYGKAAEYYQRAANHGNAHAQCNLGVLYFNGRGVPKNKARAIELYRQSAAQGNAAAIENLKRMGL